MKRTMWAGTGVATALLTVPESDSSGAESAERNAMKEVIIRRCPACPSIDSLSDSVVAALKNAECLDLRVEDGVKGEFAVEVNGRIVSKRMGTILPTQDDVVSAVRNAGAVGAGV
jgi:hypothetical protein